MKVALVGAVESTLCAMRAMIEADCDLVLVATLTPELAKRHSDFVDLAPEAEAHGVDVLRVRNINDADAIEAVRKAAPDYIFVVGWSQICREEFMNIAPGKMIGYHPAPLPRMRGRAVLPWTIINDEKISGATMFWMDDGVDTGDILEQRFFHVAPRETARTLYDKHMVALGAMTRGAIGELASGNPRREKQDDACATFAARRRPSDGKIDWNRSAVEIDRLIRAVGRPYPGASGDHEDGQLIIWRAHPLANGIHHGTIGQVVAITGDTIDIVTGDGLLRVEEWETSATKPVRMHAVLGGS